MTFGQSVSTCFSKYATFTGRASRSEYWYWVLFSFIVGVAVGIIEIAIDSEVLGYIVQLAFLLPGLAVSVRRMHDLGKGGGWIFIAAIPLIGWIWAIVLYATAGEPFANRFGEPEA